MPARAMRLVTVLTILVGLHHPADACSLLHTYLPPSNFELVVTSPRIVVAKAVGTGRSSGDPDLPVIALDVTRVIKGDAKIGERISVRGSTERYLGAGSKTDFAKARRGAFAGSCTAYDYKLGKHYVLLLELEDGRWETRAAPFTRVNEEVDPENDPWTIAVAAYAKIGVLPAAQQAKAIDALIAKKTTPTDRAISEDLARHRATPSKYKSFAELDAMYRANPDARGAVVIAIGNGSDKVAKPFMKDLVQAMRDGTSPVAAPLALEAISTYYSKVDDPPTLEQVTELYIALGANQKELRWGVMWLLIDRADPSHRLLMERALAGADDQEASQLVEFFVRYPSETAKREIAKRVGDKYGEKRELAVALATLGDRNVFAWAAKMLAAKPGHEHRKVAAHAIAASPLVEADTLAGKLIANGGKDLESLIDGYAYAHHARAEARLAELVKNPKLPADARQRLDRTIDKRSANP